ncbi:MAG: UDP-N-acetylglucosamine 2-epimerase (non-hydrolyzing) [Syntrophobacterales bacterium CG_4_8_14_3_um_filter_58_8]|nr:MAG: UDP-N-acetylglucosamine 2-epimerase (non-hydrolyzing) [Syntrophobacterales bacterium CG_4_8_14_3_um_filter_58_8]
MILVAFGTRPEIIKLFPVIEALKARKLAFRTLFTGQQIDLYEDVKALVPVPDFTFADAFAGDEKHNTLGGSFLKIGNAAEELFRRHPFDIVVVQGDTTTAWALAQMAFYNGIPVAHVEAGLRTFDLANPYPEELNRILISRVAHIHFAPTRQAADNLAREGALHVHLVGNTIVDAVNVFKAKMASSGTPASSDKVLVTLHRRENHACMDRLFDELQTVAMENPDLEIVLPIHPNPNVQIHRGRLTASNIRVIEPVGYPKMLRLIGESAFIITDSGGIQEEATCFNRKVLVVREKTERPETIDIGLGRLVGQAIAASVAWARIPPPPPGESPYGDGHAAEKIAGHLEKYGS